MSRHAARLNLVLLCNGTDFLWEGAPYPRSATRNSARRAAPAPLPANVSETPSETMEKR